MFKHLFLFAIFLSLLFSSCQVSNKSKSKNDKKYVVVLSMDGFRWDYTDGLDTPNFDKMAKQGVKAESMKVSFPSKTFPNHYTLATGLYPDNHGITNNTFYMPDRKEVYKIRNREMVEDGTIYSGEPIWVTAEKQGIKSASYFWVGSEADIQGIQPSIWKKYHHKTPFEDRADTVISWLKMDKEVAPQLIMWYVHEPDNIGHKFGPKHPETDSVIVSLDKLLGNFMQKLEQLENSENIDFIVLSDHGMCNISPERSIIVSDYLEKNWDYKIYGSNPVFSIWAEDPIKDSIYNRLKKVEHLKCYFPNETPEHLDYSSNERIGDIVIFADSSWSVFRKPTKPEYQTGGTHGFDNNNKDMDAIFFAYGPDFKENYTMGTFQNVNVYPLLAHLLDLTPAKTDGNLSNVKEMLRDCQ